ncbi:HPr kinase/phosphorylase [Aliiruegeria lutimaris]|uniref:HPr kinase/phosphorylase n=1 Tax=Aliiruegeria lutimaris TaxID=571298 RepID=UPI0011136F09|nr:hypothetical protein [Aliiruegeria lutimaris]
MKVKTYRSAGLVIESEFDLPGLVEDTEGAGVPQLRFVHAKCAPTALVDPTSTGPYWQSDGTHFHFTEPDVAVFDISAEGTVSVWPKSENPDEIAAYLVGSVLGIALHMRKIVTLHASAVEIAGGAVLLCGPSGSGKSTMAASLHRRGFTLLCDDLCAIEVSDDGAIAHSDGRKLKLWEDTIKALGLQDAKGRAVHRRYDKFFVDGGVLPRDRFPIRAIFELTTEDAKGDPRSMPLPLAEAAICIRRNAYRPFLVQHLKDEELYFEAATALLRQSEIYRVVRKHHFDELDRVVDLVLRHVQCLDK